MDSLNSESKPNLSRRLLIGIGVPLIFAVGATYLFLYGNPFPCLFYKLTGLYCSGCGSGRCCYFILHGRFLTAFGYNPLAAIAMPFCGYYILKVYIRAVFGRDVLPFFTIGKHLVWVIVAIIISFFILRNIPVFPFTLLAP